MGSRKYGGGEDECGEREYVMGRRLCGGERGDAAARVYVKKGEMV